ncbi:hypothetical protein NRB20_74590 [Nocardia sp. RB20]|uniref:Uncharacterized protein n=2 Tax=Nocardia macrotermitis TaxID=2585198 RepID=A0A7K0DHQ0_9NOCA|nr:hypothetical protein [Nocardia macrotermitis]
MTTERSAASAASADASKADRRLLIGGRLVDTARTYPLMHRASLAGEEAVA